MDGASVTERLIGAARSNNENVLSSIFSDKSTEEIAKIINTTFDPVGKGLLHLAALSGSLETLDFLLDQEGTEIDPKTRLDNNTPLHLAVEYARGPGNAQVGQQIVELLIECGAQPDPRNSLGKRPIDLAQVAGLSGIVNSLRGAQYAAEIARDNGGDNGPETEDFGEPSDEGEDLA